MAHSTRNAPRALRLMRLMRHMRHMALLALACFNLAGPASAQIGEFVKGGAPRVTGAQTGGTPTIKDVRITRQGDLAVVTIEADGALPAPRVGQLDSPPRVFLDFSAVSPGTSGSAGDEGSAVLRVRVALYTREPRVTRVVIDLSQKHPIRTEGDDREAGRFKVLVGAAAPAPDARPVTVPLLEPEKARTPLPDPPPLTSPSNRPATTEPPGRPEAVPPLPAVEPPSTRAPSSPSPPSGVASTGRPSAAPLPPRDVERYRGQVGAALTRFRQQRPLLTAIDRQDPKPPEGLTAAREEFGVVLRSLTSIKPPETIRSTHDMLVRSASFALMAATLRDDAGMRGEPEKMRNAASAAAGALLLLDRVCAELGCDLPSAAAK